MLITMSPTVPLNPEMLLHSVRIYLCEGVILHKWVECHFARYFFYFLENKVIVKFYFFLLKASGFAGLDQELDPGLNPGTRLSSWARIRSSCLILINGSDCCLFQEQRSLPSLETRSGSWTRAGPISWSRQLCCLK